MIPSVSGPLLIWLGVGGEGTGAVRADYDERAAIAWQVILGTFEDRDVFLVRQTAYRSTRV